MQSTSPRPHSTPSARTSASRRRLARSLSLLGAAWFVLLAAACGGTAEKPEPSGFEPVEPDPMDIQRHFEPPEGDYKVGDDPTVDMSPNKVDPDDGNPGVTLAANVYKLPRK